MNNYEIVSNQLTIENIRKIGGMLRVLSLLVIIINIYINISAIDEIWFQNNHYVQFIDLDAKDQMLFEP